MHSGQVVSKSWSSLVNFRAALSRRHSFLGSRDPKVHVLPGRLCQSPTTYSSPVVKTSGFRDTRLDCTVAVKILSSHLQSNATPRQDFEQSDGRQPLSYRIVNGVSRDPGTIGKTYRP